MKYLSDYMEEGSTAIFNKYGVFFAFSGEQFDEKKVEGVQYTSTGSGMICPLEHIEAVMTELEANFKAAIAQDIAENGIDAIIQRELGNHEYGYTFNLGPTVDALDGYGVTRNQVKAIADSMDWSGG